MPRRNAIPFLSVRVLCGLLALLFVVCSPAHAQTWMNSAWQYRSAVSVTNPNASELLNFQVKVTLDRAFDFTHAQSNGADLRVTGSDGITPLNFWVADWRPASNTATIWVQIPSLPAPGASIWLYHGNPAASSLSNGRATFLFFDDFEATPATPAGYFPLGAPETVFTANPAADIAVPHTMSVVEANSDGFRFAAYVGSQTCGGIGISRSNDLSNWTNPVRLSSLPADARWPSVLLINGTYYMLYTANYCSTNSIALAASTDGFNFTTVQTIVSPESGVGNRNPNLYFNPHDQKFYIYWHRSLPGAQEIRVRSAATPEGLADASSEKLLLSSPVTLAAPNILYFNGLYFLSAEVLDSNQLWATEIFSSTSPDRGFQPAANGLLLTGGNACMFQHIFDNVLHVFNCTTGTTVWTVTHRTAPLELNYGLNPAAWAANGGNWKLLSDIQENGTAGRVLMGTLSANQYLYSSFAGTDYVVEAYGRQISGRIWGIGARASSTGFYSANLYTDLSDSRNLYTYFRQPANSVVLAAASGGPVQPQDWYNLSVRVHSNQIDVFKDGILRSQSFDGNLGSGAAIVYGESGTTAEWNNFFVRQYAPVDPVTTVGSEYRSTGPPPSTVVNVAAASNGGIASASSSYSGAFGPIGANDGDRKGRDWAAGGGWNDATPNTFPDWLQIDFAGPKQIAEIDVFTLQDNFDNPVEPAMGMMFAQYGLTDFQVQYWDGSSWAVIPGGSITGNNQVWRRISFAPLTTTKIRIYVTGALASFSRITEVEAYAASTAAPPTNAAAASNGATAVASSTYSASFAPSGAIDGDRLGTSWGNGGGWNDATLNSYPDWLQVNFAGYSSISEIDIFTLQDDFASPTPPTSSMTFMQYGITDFQVQYWDGLKWENVPNGVINGNNLVWRKISFPALTTTRIRIVINGALNAFSRITEIEAY